MIAPEIEREARPVEACHNCGAPLEGPVCAQCGQRAAGRIAVGRIVGELREQVVGLDFRLLRTARGVLAAPGATIRGYLAGRRIPYTNPFKFLFLAATAYLLAVTLLDVQVTPNAEGQQGATAVVAVLNYLVYLFLVPTAWLLKVLFRRSGYNWAESYVAVC